MILGDTDCSVWGDLGGAECPLRLRVLLRVLEVACPQFMAIENYLANGDQKGEEGRI